VILQEDDAFVASKCKTALQGGIGVILCCGESLEQRERGETIEVVRSQLGTVAKELKDIEGAWKKVVIAYEPIWAIGTGKVATADQAQEVHAAIRQWLAKEVDEKTATETRIIYGGSVNEKNCKELATQKDIDGFLVGGASLKPACEYIPFVQLWILELICVEQSSISSTATSDLNGTMAEFQKIILIGEFTGLRRTSNAIKELYKIFQSKP